MPGVVVAPVSTGTPMSWEAPPCSPGSGCPCESWWNTSRWVTGSTTSWTITPRLRGSKPSRCSNGPRRNWWAMPDEGVAGRIRTKAARCGVPEAFETRTVQQMGWAGCSNGELPRLAADHGFDALVKRPCSSRTWIVLRDKPVRASTSGSRRNRRVGHVSVRSLSSSLCLLSSMVNPGISRSLSSVVVGHERGHPRGRRQRRRTCPPCSIRTLKGNEPCGRGRGLLEATVRLGQLWGHLRGP